MERGGEGRGERGGHVGGINALSLSIYLVQRVESGIYIHYSMLG